MKFIIISYASGLHGEFTADLISRSSDKFLTTEPTHVTDTNRYFFPNYLSPIGFNPKTCEYKTWNISAEEVQTLEKIYKGKEICIPTHWNGTDVSLSNLPAIGIRFYSESEYITNLAYAFAWIKSHMHSDIWDSRRIELENLVNSDHIHAKEFKDILEAPVYHNWKYLAYRFQMLKNGNADLEFFIKARYTEYLKWSKKSYHPPGWFLFDIGNAIHGDQTNITEIEQFLDIKLDRAEINSYRDRDLELIKNTLGIGIDDFSNPGWIDHLVDYVKSHI